MIRLLLTFIILIPLTLNGQQTPVLSLASKNPVFYNPSHAGFAEELRATMQYRQQWVGLTGAPETMILSLDGNVTDKMGLGLVFFNDVTDIFSQTGCFGDYSYKIGMGKGHQLRLGIGLGFIQNKIDYSKINAQTPTEDNLLNYSEKGTKFDAAFGLRYSFKQLYLDFSAQNLANSSFTYQDQANFRDSKTRMVNHFVAAVGYSYDIPKSRFNLEPWLGIRSVLGAPVQFDGNLTVTYNKLIGITGGYRQDAGFYSGISFNLFERFNIAYAYDFPNKYLSPVIKGSNEIIISYRFKKRGSEPASRASSGNLKRIEKQNQEQFQKIEQLQQENERLVKQLANTEDKLTSQKQELDKLKEIFEKDKIEMTRVKEKYEIDIDEIDSLENITDSVKAQKDFYMIVGAYLTLADAKFFQKILERELGLQTLIFEREDNKYFFVYTQKVHSRDEANKEYRRLKRMNIGQYINGNVWIYGEK
jgi:type IX secretion system PorP/SprF family membrane protein